MSEDPQDFLKLEEQDLKRMYLPTEFWQAKISDFEEGATVENASGTVYPVAQFFRSTLANMSVIKSKGYGPLICGDTGVGKTALAAMLLKEARRRKFTTFFTMVWDLRDSITNKYRFDVNTSVMERCREVDFLVLDGLVPEDKFQRVLPVSEVERLVVWRGQQAKVTIVTTRLKSPAEFKKEKIDTFLTGTGAYLTPVVLQGEGARSTRKAKMRDVFFVEDDE